MARSNAAKNPALETATPPVVLVEDLKEKEIKQKKEMKLEKIESVFDAAKERVKGKEDHLAAMHAELVGLLNQIPDKENGDFTVRLHRFADRFGTIKNHLDNMVAESQLPELESGAFAPVDATESSPVSKSNSHISELKNFKDTSGAILNGAVNEKIKDKPIFRGSMVFKNGDHYVGFSILSADGSYKFHGEGSLEKDGGKMALEGFFQNGKLKNGHLIEKLADGRTRVVFAENEKAARVETGYFNSNNQLEGVGEIIDQKHGVKERGDFVNGELRDGYVVDLISGKPLEKWENGKQVEAGENLPAEITNSEKSFDRRLAAREKEREIKVEEVFEAVSGLDGLVNFEDVSNQVLNGKITHTPKSEHIFDGEIKSDSRGYKYQGQAILESDGVFRFHGQGKRTAEMAYAGKVEQEGEFSYGTFLNGVGIYTGQDMGYGADKVTEKMENGKTVERVFYLEKYKDKKDVLFAGQMFEKEFSKDNLYVGEFTMPNGSVYKGEAFKNKKGQFELVSGKSERIKSATVIDKFKDLFRFGRNKKEESKLATAEVQSEVEAEAEQAPEVVGEQAFLLVTPGGENYALKGIATDQSDGSRKFNGEIKNIDNGGEETGFQYSGEAILSSNNEITFHGKGKKSGAFFDETGEWNMGELENGEIHSKDGELLKKYVNGQEVAVTKPAEKSKEKSWIGKKLESAKESVASAYNFVTTKEGARLSNQAAYKIATGFVGIKIGTDIALAAYAGALNKVGEKDWFSEAFKKRLKEEAAVAGEYSDVYKHLGGREQIAAIKAGFAEFMSAVNPEENENVELNLVDEKYSALKAKIESSNRINQEAKGKFLAKLEEINQKFDHRNEKLDEQEVAEASAYMKAYIVNDTAAMQIARDSISGVAKAVMVGASGGSSLLLAGAIGRVMGMATTKVVERAQKSRRFNEQAALENKKTFNAAEDIKAALLETMHGLTFSKFNAGKDVKTGKDLDKKALFANFAKSFGNVLISAGVVLGLEGKTIGSAINELVHKISGDGSNAEFGRQMAQNVSAKVAEAKGVNLGKIPDNAPVAAAIAAAEAKAAAVAAGTASDHVASNGLENSADTGAGENSALETFYQEHPKLSSDAKAFFDDLVKQHTKLNNPDFLKKLWEVSGNSKSSLDITGAKVQTAIFTEIIHSEGKEAAVAYLKDETHLHGLALQKLGKDGVEAFVERYLKGDAGVQAKLENKLYGAMKADIDTDLTNKGFIQRHGDGSVRDVGAAKGRHFFGVGKDGKPVLDDGKVSRFTHHSPEHSVAGSGKTALDKIVSGEKLPKVGLHEQKIGIGPNIQKGIPTGWAAASEAGPKGQAMVNGFMDEQGHGRFLIHSTDPGSEFDVDRDMRMVDSNSGKIFDLDGNHVGYLNAPMAENTPTPVSATPGRASWSSGGNGSEKGNATQNVVRAERSVDHGGGGAPKEQAVVAPAEQEPAPEEKKPVRETRAQVKAPGIEDMLKAEQTLQEDMKVGKSVEAEPVPVVKEITSLEDGREAIAALEYLDGEEKTRLSNFSYLLQWQHDLYGQNGSTLRNMLEGQDAFGTLGKDQINSMMAELAHNNELASREFMRAVSDHQPYDKIIEKLNDKMPGYAMFHDEDNAGFVDKIIKTDLSQNAGENKAAFRDLELARVKEMVDQAEVNKLMQARQAKR